MADAEAGLGTHAWLTDPGSALWAAVATNVWVGIPFNMILLLPGLQAIPDELYEAAAIDGAGPWQRFRHITLPLLRPVALSVILLGVIYTFKVFDVVFVLTGGGPVDATTVLPIEIYNVSLKFFRFGEGAAESTLLLLAMLVVAAGLPVARAAGGVDGMTRSRHPYRKTAIGDRDRRRPALPGLLDAADVAAQRGRRRAQPAAAGPDAPADRRLLGARCSTTPTSSRRSSTASIISVGTMVVTLLLAVPGRLRAGPPARALRRPGAADPARHAVAAGHRGGDAAVRDLQAPRAAELLPRADPRRRDADRARSRSSSCGRSSCAIPRDLESAAMVDGCRPLGAFLRVVLPVSRPGVITVAVLSFLLAWGEFLFALSLTTSTDVQPLTVALAKFSSSTGTPWSQVMAVARSSRCRSSRSSSGCSATSSAA